MITSGIRHDPVYGTCKRCGRKNDFVYSYRKSDGAMLATCAKCESIYSHVMYKKMPIGLYASPRQLNIIKQLLQRYPNDMYEKEIEEKITAYRASQIITDLKG